MIHNRELIELYKSGNLLQLLKTYTYNNDLQLIKELEKDKLNESNSEGRITGGSQEGAFETFSIL